MIVFYGYSRPSQVHFELEVNFNKLSELDLYAKQWMQTVDSIGIHFHTKNVPFIKHVTVLLVLDFRFVTTWYTHNNTYCAMFTIINLYR